MSTPPTIREELSRKALEQLERLLLDKLSAKITEAQFAVGLDVLWNVASGLTDKDFFGMVSAADVNKNDPSFRRAVMMTCREHWIMTVVDPVSLSVIVYRNGGSPPKELICESLQDALDMAAKIQQKAHLSGYSIIN